MISVAAEGCFFDSLLALAFYRQGESGNLNFNAL
jgi:hypothetical protein